MKEQILTKLRGKKILITGGSGFIGTSVLTLLLDLNESHHLDLTLYSLSRSSYPDSRVISIQHDLALPLHLKKSVDYVIHAATPAKADPSQPQKFIELSQKGTIHLLEALKEVEGKHLLFISSGAVYEGLECPKMGYEESMVSSKINSEKKLTTYAEGKILGEQVLWQNRYSTINIQVARCFAFSGRFLPLDQQFAIGNFVQNGLNGEDIRVKGDGTAVRSYLDSEDMGYWLLAIMLNAPAGSIYNVGSDETITVGDLAHKVASHFDQCRVLIEKVANQNAVRSTYFPNIDRAKRELGLDILTTLDDSIEKMIKSRKQGV